MFGQNTFGEKTLETRVGVSTVKVTVLLVSIVCPGSEFSWAKIVCVSGVDGEANLISGV